MGEAYTARQPTRDSDENAVLDLPTQNERIQKAKTALLGYDYNSIATQIRDTDAPITGIPLRSDNFERSGVNRHLLDQAEQLISAGTVPILGGAYRMGKSSIGLAWESAKEDTREFVDVLGRSITEDDIQYLEGSEVFIDEVNPTTDNIQAIVRLAKEGKKLFLSTDLIGLRPLVEALQGQDIPVAELVVPLQPESSLVAYVSKVLNLQEDDELVATIATLSGGCPFVTNILCYRLISGICYGIDEDKEIESEEFGRDLIYEAQRQLEQHISAWQKLSEKTPDDLKSHIPDPLLQYL